MSHLVKCRAEVIILLLMLVLLMLLLSACARLLGMLELEMRARRPHHVLRRCFNTRRACEWLQQVARTEIDAINLEDRQ